MLTSSGGGGGGGGRSMLTVADRGRGKICQNLADVICERSLSNRINAVAVVTHRTTVKYWSRTPKILRTHNDLIFL